VESIGGIAGLDFFIFAFISGASMNLYTDDHASKQERNQNKPLYPTTNHQSKLFDY